MKKLNKYNTIIIIIFISFHVKTLYFKNMQFFFKVTSCFSSINLFYIKYLINFLILVFVKYFSFAKSIRKIISDCIWQVVSLGKKLLVMQWRHSAAWTAWCPASDTDTVDGFQYLRVSCIILLFFVTHLFHNIN